MLIIHVKYRKLVEISYHTMFGGILKLTSCYSSSIVEAVKQFYSENDIDLQKMVKFTYDGASVMLGKRNGVAAFCGDIYHIY